MKRPRALGGRREFERGRGARGVAGPRFEELEKRHLLTTVTGRHVFYNQSAFDGNDPAITGASDDAAIAIDKNAYRPDVNFTVRRITANGVVDQEPRAFGQYVIWQGRGGTDGGSDEEIFLFDGVTTTQLTENTVVDRFPKMSELGIFWERGSGTSQEIIYWDGDSETNLTTNSVFDGNASLSDDRLVWEQGSGNGIEIMSWTGGSVVNLSNNAVVDRFPAADGDNAVWVNGSVPTAKIQRSNAGGAPVDVNGDGSYSTTFALADPKLSGPMTVWEGFRYSSADATGREIYLDKGDGSAVVEVTNNTFSDFDPQIDGGNIVWWGGVFNDFQVYHSLNGSAPTPLSSGIRNQFPQISGTHVVWQHFDGNDDEIYWWNGQEVIPLTDNTLNDQFPRIHGDHVVWTAMTGSDGLTLEIYDALLGNAPSDFPNVTSYSRGINGIMIDLLGVEGDHESISLASLATDFVFKVGNNNTPSSWASAPTPNAVSVRTNIDGSGTDRVVITWANGAIANKWLEVQVLPSANTGLMQVDRFYWGNKIGDIGNPTATSFTTTAAGDATPIVAGGLGPAGGITNPRDIDRSNTITAAGDRALAMANIGAITRLHLTGDSDNGDEDGGAGDWGIASALTSNGSSATPSTETVSTNVVARLDDPGGDTSSASEARTATTRSEVGASLDSDELDEAWLLDEDLLAWLEEGSPGP